VTMDVRVRLPLPLEQRVNLVPNYATEKLDRIQWNDKRTRAIQLFKAGINPRKIREELKIAPRTMRKWVEGLVSPRQVGNKKPASIRAKALQMFRDGEKTSVILVELGIGMTTLRHWKDNAGLTKRTRQKLITDEEFIELYRSDLSYRQIKEKLNCSMSYVQKKVLRLGLAGNKPYVNPTMLCAKDGCRAHRKLGKEFCRHHGRES